MDVNVAIATADSQWFVGWINSHK